MLSLIRSHLDRLVFLGLRATAGGTRAARYLGVRVGEGCRLLNRDFGSEPWLISIGNRVTIAPEVSLLTHDGSCWLVRDESGRRFRYARVEIGDDVFIGLGSIVMPGVRIGSRVVVGAGSVVTKSVPSGWVVAGNPARLMVRYEDFEQRVLRECHRPGDMSGTTYRERIDSIVEQTPRSELRSD